MSSKKEGDEFVRPLIDLMKFGGLWFDFDDSRFGIVFKSMNVARHSMSVIVCLLQIHHWMTTGADYLLKESAVFIPIGLSEGSVAFSILFNLTKVSRIVDYYKIKLGFYSQQTLTRRIVVDEFDKFNRIFLLFKLGLIVFYFFYVVVPITFDGIQVFLDKEPYVVPLPLNFLLNEPPTRNVAYFLDLVFSYLFLLVIVPRYIAFQGILLYFVIFVVVDIKVLMWKLSQLTVNDDGTPSIQKGWNLKEVVQHHNEIVDVVTNRYDFIGLALHLQNVFNSVSSCLVLFLLKTSLKNGDYVLTGFCSTFLLWLIPLIVMLNASGTIIENQSEELMNAIYGIPWYKQPPRIRKLFLPMVRQSIKLLTIKYEGSPINLNSSMRVLNQAYSFFTLINSKS